MDSICDVRTSGWLDFLRKLSLATDDTSVVPVLPVWCAIHIPIKQFRDQCGRVHVLGIFQACVRENLRDQVRLWL